MDYTYLDYFNYYLKEFLNELIMKFPECKGNVLQNYRSLLEGKDDKNDLYAKYYYTKINNYLIAIAKKDVTIFNNPGIIFIQGVDFHNIWNHSLNNDESRVVIWKYLQLLMILGRKIIPDHKEIVELLQKVGGEVNIPAKVQQTLSQISEEEKESESSGGFDLGNIMNMASSLGGLGGGGKGGLGGLDINDMVKNLTETLGNLPTPDQFESFNENTEGGENSENTNSEESTNNTSTTPNIGTGLFSELAEEMSQVFDFDELEKDGEPKNVGEAFQKFMSGNNPAKMMNMVNKFGSKLQNDISSGKINQQDLLKETLGMMNNLQKGSQNPDILRQEAEKLIGNNPNLKKKFEETQQKNATRDRLRQKLADKQQEQNQDANN